MLLYSKLYDLITGRSKSQNSQALKCTVKEIYGFNDQLQFIHFNTENNVPCLLYIPPRFEIKMGGKKFLPLLKWNENRVNFESILAADSEISIIPEVQATSSPQGLIEFIKRLEPSLKSISYKIGVISEEYLIVLIDDQVEVFYVKGPKESKLLVLLNLEMLLFKNIVPELERVHKNIIKLIQESTDKYWNLLLELLKKCHELKIITKGKQNLSTSCLIEQNIKVGMSHKAIKLALECCFNQ